MCPRPSCLVSRRMLTAGSCSRMIIRPRPALPSAENCLAAAGVELHEDGIVRPLGLSPGY
eukprot:364255-Chlamydomonas_euryale.AAC.5